MATLASSCCALVLLAKRRAGVALVDLFVPVFFEPTLVLPQGLATDPDVAAARPRENTLRQLAAIHAGPLDVMGEAVRAGCRSTR